MTKSRDEATQAQTPRRRWALSPHLQLAITGLVGISLTTLVLFGSVTRLDGVRHGLRDARTRLEAPDAKLMAVESALGQAAANLREFTTVRDDVVRATPLLASAVAQGSVAANAWAAYQRRAPNLRGERRLRQRFEADRRQLADAQIVVATAPVSPPEVVAAMSGAASAVTTDLQALRALYAKATRQADAAVLADADATRRFEILWFPPLLVGCLIAIGIAAASAARQRRGQRVLDTERTQEMARTLLEADLQQAFEMAPTEETSYGVVEEAMHRSVAPMMAELLVADSSRAHFRRVAVSSDDADAFGCGVGGPMDCPATTRGQTLTFTTSDQLAACPFLRDRPGGACSAVCVPLSIAGKTIGVLHATGPDTEAPDRDAVATLELVARKSGERLGILRAFARTQTQARTDPLTGLLNRRSLENEVVRLVEDERRYVVAYGDLDHFKMLNDVHGHDAGDRALRLFARVLRDNVRPSDLPARYGGEEFVVVLPDCSTSDAIAVLERVRDHLALAQQHGTVTAFTVSFGVAASESGRLFSETVEEADAALRNAKAAGRDCVVSANGAANGDGLVELPLPGNADAISGARA